jgi:hypothetical protein
MAAIEKRPPVVTASASGTSLKQNDPDIGTITSRQQVAQQIDPALAEHAAAIRALGKRVIDDVIEIGRRLADCKERVGHGGWRLWLKHEFGWTDDTALNFMRVYEMSKSRNFRNLNIGVSSLYLLAAPSTPGEARATVMERAETGEAVPVKEVKRVLQEARQGEAEQAELGEEIGSSETGTDNKDRRQTRSKPAPGARRGAVRPSPRPARQPAAVPPLDSRSWSETAEKDKKQAVGSPSARERFLSAIGYDDWWHCAPEAFRERARRELLATPSAPAGEIANDLGAAKDDPMAIPAALKRTAPTDRFGRPRPEFGSLLKPGKK